MYKKKKNQETAKSGERLQKCVQKKKKLNKYHNCPNV